MAVVEAPAQVAAPRVPTWVQALLPPVLIALLLAGFLAANPLARFRSVPPAEVLAVERTVLTPGVVELSVRNDGPNPVAVAQVQVNDAYWSFATDDAELGRFESSRFTIAYPWEEGFPLNIALVTSTGVVVPHQVPVAALTPVTDGATLWTLALVGLCIGVVPIGVGLLWFPALRRARPAWITAALAFTVGLLGFLLVDTIAEGLELAALTPTTFDGLGLFAVGAVAALLGLTWLGGALTARGRATGGLVLAYLVSAGIGLHNLGEGLAVGSALAVGEASLGAFLVLGFAVHNSTEGLAIIAPMGREGPRPALRHFVLLAMIAGLPAVVGAWGGGFLFSPGLAALAFGLAAGAIAQVVWQVGGGLSRRGVLASGPAVLGLLAGFLFMYGTGLLVA